MTPSQNVKPDTVTPAAKTPSGPESAERRKVLRTLICGSVALALGGGTAGYFFFRTPPMTDEEWAKYVTKTIGKNFNVLSRDLQLLWLDTETKLDKAFGVFARDLRNAGEAFSSEKITRRNIAGLVVDMARDRIDNKNRADQWFEENLDPYLQPAFMGYSQSLVRIERGFEEQFSASVGDFNERVVADLSGDVVFYDYTPSKEVVERSVERSFQRQGLRFGAGAGLGIGVALGGAGVHFYGKLMATLVSRIKQLFLRLLRPVARKLATRMGAAIVTSKIPPLAIIVAALGAGWTAYEIYILRDRARDGFDQALDLGIVDMRKELDSEVKIPLIKNMASYQDGGNALKREIVGGILKA